MGYQVFGLKQYSKINKNKLNDKTKVTRLRLLLLYYFPYI
ncbi:hypothetical protein KL86DYS2_13232 [uncultured Dysgonomonas sp.]|uniref:Uncharacterized protein n=1 Tax=uncultured Dysgonomonas sp. TaxID=206096 RepID=A0A212K7V7_9BACT|nr:hypothetical protein KL86DYS2_13232 [uncultured Dysgonomonas sp.]